MKSMSSILDKESLIKFFSSLEILEETSSDDKKLKLIASGGISTFSELPELAELGCEGTIIGKAIYEGRIQMKELEKFILEN